MGPSNISLLSFRVIFHFYDYGRKGKGPENYHLGKKTNMSLKKKFLRENVALIQILDNLLPMGCIKKMPRLDLLSVLR